MVQFSIILLLLITLPKYLLQHTVSSSSIEPSISCFLSKMHSLTYWQLCQTWWNASCKFDKEAWQCVLKKFKGIKENYWVNKGKKDWWTTVGKNKSNHVLQTSSIKILHMWDFLWNTSRNQSDFVTHSAAAQNRISLMWCTT